MLVPTRPQLAARVSSNDGDTSRGVTTGTTSGNCAAPIPDENGDTGACARIEGDAAVEDWCPVWGHVSAELCVANGATGLGLGVLRPSGTGRTAPSCGEEV